MRRSLNYYRRVRVQTMIVGENYAIEETGLDGWMTYRYEYSVRAYSLVGYAETEEEALANMEKEIERLSK